MLVRPQAGILGQGRCLDVHIWSSDGTKTEGGNVAPRWQLKLSLRPARGRVSSRKGGESGLRLRTSSREGWVEKRNWHWRRRRGSKKVGSIRSWILKEGRSQEEGKGSVGPTSLSEVWIENI